MLPRTIDRWPRWAWLVPMAVVVAYGLALAVFSEASLPRPDAPWQLWPYLSVQPVGEDAFYYLSTAWNLARGEGLTVHGYSSVTGIQPLFPILLAVPAKIIQWLGGTKWHLIRVVIVLTTFNFALFALMTARLAERISKRVDWRASLVVFVLTICSFSLFRLFTYGLETGLYLTLVVASVLASFRLGSFGSVDGSGDQPPDAAWSPWVVGLVFGVTGLARIDFGVALGVFLCGGLVLGWFRLKDALASGATAAAVVSPWLGYVYYHMGTIVPSSGVAESNYIRSEDLTRRLLSTAQALMEIVTPMYFVRLGNTIANIGGFVALGVVAAVAWLFRDNFEGLLRNRALGWLAAFAVLGAVYLSVFRSAWFYHRYFSPLYLFALPVLGVAVVEAVERFRSRSTTAQWTTALVAVMSAQFFVWAGLVLHRDTAVSAQQLPAYVNHALGAGAIERELPAEAGRTRRIGAFQSGTIGYFHEDVINLDGKVNNEVLGYLAERNICEYLDEMNVEYVVDWKTIIDYHMPDACIGENWRACGVEMPGPYICLERRGAANDG